LVTSNANRWESRFKLDIPKFQSSLQLEEFLDWVLAVEEDLDFTEVSDDWRVPLVATKFRRRAAGWWQLLKQSRVRQWKAKINSWEKLLKHMRATFLHHNYVRIM
jgi:hypothetical protein